MVVIAQIVCVWSFFMRRFLLLAPLIGVLMLLTACPDDKLPTPAPKVPTPKAEPPQTVMQLRTPALLGSRVVA